MSKPIEVDQIIRSKRKTLAIIVKADGSLIVRVPLRASMLSIRAFVEKNVRWIEKKQAEAREAVHPTAKQYVSGELFTFLGNNYPLQIVKGQKEKLILDENRFKLAESAQNDAARVFERWYREQAARILNERVSEYARQYGFQYMKIGITSARTRWGSCSATGSLSFSWRLILTPLEILDYVIIHELVHTVVHNHSKQFWSRMEKIMPEYKERRNWLQKHGAFLID
jgi:predicted metal-dependent hydrolase